MNRDVTGRDMPIREVGQQSLCSDVKPPRPPPIINICIVRVNWWTLLEQHVDDLLSTVPTTQVEALRERCQMRWNKNALLNKTLARCLTKRALYPVRPPQHATSCCSQLYPSRLLLHSFLFQILFMQLVSAVRGFYEGV